MKQSNFGKLFVSNKSKKCLVIKFLERIKLLKTVEKREMSEVAFGQFIFVTTLAQLGTSRPTYVKLKCQSRKVVVFGVGSKWRQE